jgi:hypothetical protein
MYFWCAVATETGRGGQSAMHIVKSLLCLPLLAGCATIMEGTGQSMSISTNPAGALCNVDRTGTHLGTIVTTPGSLRVDKGKADITVSCSKEGYQAASVEQSPKFVATTFGNILLGGLVGVVVDAASGANFDYPAEVRLELAPLDSPPGANSAVPATPAAENMSKPSEVAASRSKRSQM